MRHGQYNLGGNRPTLANRARTVYARQFSVSVPEFRSQQRPGSPESTNHARSFPGRLPLLLPLVLMPLLVWSAWSWGRHGLDSPFSLALQVTGASMAPTLSGESEWAHCGSCSLRWQVDPLAKQREPRSVICSHCGDPLELVDHDPIDRSQPFKKADVVSIRQVPMGDLARVDLVAIEWDDRLPSFDPFPR